MKNCGSYKRNRYRKNMKIYSIYHLYSTYTHCKKIHSSLSTTMTNEYLSFSEILKQNKAKSTRMR
jgi:hypothetical protein